MSRPPRVLHLTTTAVSLDWLLAPQLHAFADAGFVVSTISGGGPHVSSLESQGIDHHTAPSLSRNFDVHADVRAVRELRSLFQRLQPDIVHTHNPKPGVIGRLLGRTCRIPIVVNTVHGLYAQPSDRARRRFGVHAAERVAAACSDAELVQNPEDVDTLVRLGVPAARVHLLGNGIDLPRFTRRSTTMRHQLRAHFGIDAVTPVIGMVGRLVWEKGYREFFDAIIELRTRNLAPFEVVVVGPMEPSKDGAVNQRTIDEMARRGIRFLGSRTDVPDVLSMFDIFALPSHREGFPRAAMEASAMGLPVVATDIRGCRQVVVHDETGFLVTPRDSSELCDALSRLLDQPELRARMGLAAERRASAEFDQERVIARTLAVYRSLLRRRGLPIPHAMSSRYSDSIDLVAVEASNRAAEFEVA